MVPSHSPPFRLLILGDGNFSFSLALARILFPRSTDQHITPLNAHVAHAYLGLPYPSFPASRLQILTTSFDTRPQLYQKYQDSKEILAALEERYRDNVTVLHGVNAWELRARFGDEYPEGFDAIVWNHPHLGTEDFRLHRFLMAHFFQSVADVLSPTGCVCVSLVQGQETRWELVAQAARSNLGLAEVMAFDESYWPGYVVKRNKHGGSFKNSHTKQHVGTDMKSHMFRFRFGEARISAASLLDVDVVQGVDGVVEAPSDTTSNKKLDSPSSKASPRRSRKGPVPADLTCPHCRKTLTSARGYHQHVHMVHILKQFGETWRPDRPKSLSCPSCPRTFASESDRWQHIINKHTTIDSSELPTTREEEEGFGRDATGEYDYYPCRVCGQAVVKRTWGMTLHLETLKPAIGLDMGCPLCANTFIEQRALYQHYKFCRLKEKKGGVVMGVERSE
ncbi:hypothetical protein HK104_000991 [Borealophlyctis nickersoniae]|nr:hypothetical protein HK104_000991 [Borealophlyctis nickersoniae]